MKDKIINIILVLILVFLTINLFNSKQVDKDVKNIISINTSSSYSIPAWIKVEVRNETLNDFSFNTCDDFSIKKESLIIKPSKCLDITIKSTKNYIIDLSDEFSKFEQTWKYFATLKKDNIDIITQFEVNHRWVFWKFFVFLFYAPIYNLMAFLLEMTNYSLGWAIIIITIIIRIILLVPQHKMMVSQARMQKIQPKIKEVQDKHKWNNQLLWVELMRLYKEEKVNPMWSCWLLLIQMPILIVIYRVILWIQDTSNTYYLYSFLSNYDMGSIISIFYSIDLYWKWWLNWFILAIIVWWLQFVQVKLSFHFNKKSKSNSDIVLEKKKDTNDYSNFMPDPEMLNKFMLYGMPIMIAFVTYTFYAWVWLYWWIWTIFMILQQLIVNKILKK